MEPHRVAATLSTFCTRFRPQITLYLGELPVFIVHKNFIRCLVRINLLLTSVGFARIFGEWPFLSFQYSVSRKTLISL